MNWEFKNISNYLPYNLQVIIYSDNEPRITTMDGLSKNPDEMILLHDEEDFYLNSDYNTFSFKPILRPYSDLIKEIENNGERFIPLVELAKLSGDKIKAVLDLTYRKFETENHEQYKIEYVDDSKNMTEFNFNPHLDRFWKAINHDYIAFVNQKQLFEKLHEWGFDTGNYIQSSLAVDINSL